MNAAHSSQRTFLLYGLTFVLAFCSLVYEFLIAQTVSLCAANTVVWYSVVVGVFIGSMGLGAWFHDRHPVRGEIWARLFRVEALLCLVGGGAVVLTRLAHLAALYFFSIGMLPAGTVVFFAVAFVAAFGVGFLTGIELPLLMDMAEEGGPVRAGIQARVLGMDYLGALVAGIVFPLFIVPYFDLIPASWGVALVNIGAAFVILFFFGRGGKGVLVIGFITSVFLGLLFVSPAVEDYFLNKYYFSFYDGGHVGRFFAPHAYPGQVGRARSAYQTIDLVHWPYTDGPVLRGLVNAFSQKFRKDPRSLRGLVFFLNGDFQFTSDFEDVYHETFAHVPILAHGRVPQRILVLGAGDGLLARELLKYPGVRSVTLVELDKKVIDLFRREPALIRLNKGAFHDSRLKVVVGDAYYYVKTSKERFDAVYLDFPAPVDYDLGKLYSRELYALLKKRLAPGGFIVLDAPGMAEETLPLVFEDETDETLRVRMDAWRVFVRTLKAAGFPSILPFTSRLEEDNEAALDVLRASLGDKEAARLTTVNTVSGQTAVAKIQGKEDIVRSMVRDHVLKMRAGFLMAWAEAGREPQTAFWDTGVEYNVMNARRFALSLSDGRMFTAAGEEGRVNSIFRPSLPLLEDWHKIRTAY